MGIVETASASRGEVRDAEASAPLRLIGVDHTARPTWKLAETVGFYRDVMGLALVHVISARGWGPPSHPDFLHFFFDSGNGSTIAFFHYLGESEPDDMAARPGRRPWPEDHVFDATHTAWRVESVEELRAWKDRLSAAGVEVSVETAHETIESIYFRDPNGYFIEITHNLRPVGRMDALDAALTLEAAIEASKDAAQRGERLRSIDEIWTLKARSMAETRSEALDPVTIYVPDLPEFQCLARAAKAEPRCRVQEPRNGYWRIAADEPVTFERRALGLSPAVWYGLFTGGVAGHVTYDRDRVRIEPVERAD